jgi:hypothetical protein
MFCGFLAFLLLFFGLGYSAGFGAAEAAAPAQPDPQVIAHPSGFVCIVFHELEQAHCFYAPAAVEAVDTPTAEIPEPMRTANNDS